METVALKDLCLSVTDCPHSTPKWTDSGKIVIRNQNIKNGRLDLSTTYYTDEDNFQKRCARAVPEPGDLIITREAPMGEVCLIPENLECCLGQRMVLLKPNTEICDSKYMLYCLLSRNVQQQISWSEGTGTTVSNLRIPHLEQLQIPYCDLEKQKRIAAVLGVIDDLIDNNEKMTENLSNQIQNIYTEWFTEMTPFNDEEKIDTDQGIVPKKWDVMPLEDFIFFQEGPGIRNWQYVSENGTKFINIRCINGGDIDLTSANMISNEEANGKYAHFMLKENDIVISCSGTLGRYAIVRKEHLPLCLNTSIIRFQPKRCESDYAYVYSYLTSKEFANKQQEMASGSVQVNFGPTHLKKIMMVVPPIETLKEYSVLVMPVIKQMIRNRSEKQKLTEVKNLLLDKLIKGDIDVANVTI